MKYETVSTCRLPKIGFGTWSIGGGSVADHSIDVQSLAALRSALELGYTHFDTAEMYASGHTEELLGHAIRDTGIRREQLFITTKVSAEHLAHQSVLDSCEASLRRLGLDYIDLYLIHWPSKHIKLADSFRALNKLVNDGKVRYLGVSNFDLKLLRAARRLSATPIITNQVPYSVLNRSYSKNGVLEYCQKNDILVTAYSPFEGGKLRMSKALATIAERRSSTPEQIALAWLCNQPRVITIPMSREASHQRENLEAAEIVLHADELAQLA